ncbi:MAG TPA: serine hydrolase [Gemmatimonadaceae bacterium]|nr:serine hydrolase [Gemmatimonadaceae bacterium]
MTRPQRAIRTFVQALILTLLVSAAAVGQTAATYYPGPGSAWQRKRPADVGMDSTALAAAVAFAQKNEIGFLKDMAAQVREQTKNEPYPDVLGPTRDRTGQNGIVIRHGYIVAEWGDTEKVDMTFSVAKSYVATMAGLALDRGKIRNVNDKVAEYVKDGGFDSPHNAKITWHMLLNQTSEWEGTLFEKPDVADRREGRDRALREPGTFWEYNDVRVNRASLAIMRVWGEALPVVLKREIMDPIGASPTWEWHGYRTSFVDLNGQRVQSVSGGGHWGGGVWASTRDHARFGLLHLRRGKWNGKQLLSEKWIDMATAPTDIRPVYGYMWWLNNDKGTTHAGATPKSFFARGAGGNTIWICPELDLVVVTRWLDTRVTNDFMRMIQAAVKP